MNRKDATDKVIEAIAKIQEDSGRLATSIQSSTRPFRDVEGFDSHSGVEATLLLSEMLGQELPDSVFIPKKGRQILSVTDIAENICEVLS